VAKKLRTKLDVIFKTVKSHVYNIYQKLNVQSRLQLMNTIRDYFSKKKTGSGI